MPARLTPADLLRLRLGSQLLSGKGGAGPEAVVRQMLAIQAQDFPASRWAVGARSPGSTDADVLAALAEGRVLRSWPMRGTLHLVPPEDFGWMRELTTARLLAKAAAMERHLELSKAIMERARTLATEALGGGQSMSRDAFMSLLQADGLRTDGQRGYHIIFHLAQTGTLSWGPPQGTQQALVLLDEWVPHPRRLERDEALGEFVRRYLVGHGPATLHDFAGWSGLTMADAKVGLAVAREDLVELEVDGASHWLAAEAEPAPATAAQRRRLGASAHLLPGFDEYYLGYRQRGPVVDPEHVELVVPGRNGIFKPMLLAGGRVAGVWRRGRAKDAVRVELEPFGSLGQGHRAALEGAVERYGAFLARAATVDWVEAGAHPTH